MLFLGWTLVLSFCFCLSPKLGGCFSFYLICQGYLLGWWVERKKNILVVVYICHKEEGTSSFVVHGYSIICSHVKGTFETLWISCNLKTKYVGCRNPSFGLATKAKGLQGCGPRGSPGVTSETPGSVGECEGVSLHTPKATPKLGEGVPMDS